ncbi:MAG: TlpA family protein disulfide reductase [Armatimonadetes bacterium]|nr:TlpA family protein disulfide reductase [Armatimonadota bacterium]
MKIGTDIPSLAGATGWIGGEVKSADLLGNPALIHFWSISCGLCSEQMPQLVAWRDQMAGQGLKVVGVHMPRSEADTDVAAVVQATIDYGLTQPVAIDNEHNVADAFANQFVPAFYLFDREGHLRQFVAGEYGLKMMERALERVFAASSE